MELILIVSILLIIGHFVLKRKYDIVTTYFVYRHQTPLQKRIEIIGIVVYIILIILFAFYLTSATAVYSLILAGAIARESFRAYMEYKHEKETKHYILNCYWSIGYFILLLVGVIFLNLSNYY